MKYISVFTFSLILLCGFSYLSMGNSPEEQQPFEFSHKLHVVDEEIECTTCHEMAESSTTGKDNLIPTKEICLDCHDEDEIGNPATVPPITDYRDLFSHQRHLASDLKCETCHESVMERTDITPSVLPDMKNCMNCHERKSVSKDCYICHSQKEDLRPVSHSPNFIHNHSDLARNATTDVSGNKDCALCHKKRFCQDCHEGDIYDRIPHPLNYAFTHALYAQGKERECSVCHMERQFCIECHADFQVLPKNHTAGWSNRIPNDGGRHRIEAENDLDACMACHEQDAELTCQPCHGPKN